MKKVTTKKKGTIADILTEILIVDMTRLRMSVKRLGIAIWVLVVYNIIMTGAFLLLLYGNQYLVR